MSAYWSKHKVNTIDRADIKEVKHKNICKRLLLHSGKRYPLISAIHKVPVLQGRVLEMCCPEEKAYHNYSYYCYC